MSEAPGPNQEAFRAQPQISGWPRHLTVPAMPAAVGICCQPWGQQGLPQPCTHLPLTTKGSPRLGWKPVCAQGKEGDRENFGGVRDVHGTGPCALRMYITFPLPGQRDKPPRRGYRRHTWDQSPHLTGTNEPGSGGARSARWREGDWAEARRRQRAEAEAPSPSHVSRFLTGQALARCHAWRAEP